MVVERPRYFGREHVEPAWLGAPHARRAKAGEFDLVVAKALDCISRDQEDLAGIHKRLRFAGIEIRIAQDGVAGDIRIGVKGLLGALYLKDLAQKIRRGQASVVRDGSHNGGRSYGYRPISGRAGELDIDQAEAVVICQIFADYLNARSLCDIAAALNKKGHLGPRGGVFNASTIGGSRNRQSGILQNELYAGRILWNRQTFIKDPQTGRGISCENPCEQWMLTEAEHLRIIDIWARVQARKERGGAEGDPCHASEAPPLRPDQVRAAGRATWSAATTSAAPSCSVRA